MDGTARSVRKVKNCLRHRFGLAQQLGASLGERRQPDPLAGERATNAAVRRLPVTRRMALMAIGAIAVLLLNNPAGSAVRMDRSATAELDELHLTFLPKSRYRLGLEAGR